MERYETIGEAVGLMMVCTVSLGMAARVAWEDWRGTHEAQQLAELAVETLEAAKPHAERLVYQAINLIARPVLNHLGQSGEVLNGNQTEAQALPAFEGGAIQNGTESPVIGVAVPTVQCSKSQLVSLIWRRSDVPLHRNH